MKKDKLNFKTYRVFLDPVPPNKETTNALLIEARDPEDAKRKACSDIRLLSCRYEIRRIEQAHYHK